MRVDLGNDRWAEILDVEDVPRRVKLRVQQWALNAMHADEQHPGTIDMVMRDTLMAYVVTAWSFEKPIPDGEPDRIGDLPSSAYDKLLTATQGHYDDLDFLRKSDNSSDSKTSSTASPSKGTSRQTGTSAR
jgi:hypothetical protein